MTSVKTRRFGSGNEGAMGTVDGKYSSPSPRDPAPQISMLLPSEQEMPKKATSDVALTNNFEIWGWGEGWPSGYVEEYVPSTVGHVGFADKRHTFFGNAPLPQGALTWEERAQTTH